MSFGYCRSLCESPATKISLFCWVLELNNVKAFSVTISLSEVVGDLKEAIMNENEDTRWLGSSSKQPGIFTLVSLAVVHYASAAYEIRISPFYHQPAWVKGLPTFNARHFVHMLRTVLHPLFTSRGPSSAVNVPSPDSGGAAH